MRHRILHIIYSLYRGGAERVIETQVRLGDRDRFEYLVCSITGGGDLAGVIAESGGRVFLMRKRHRGDPAAAWRIARLIDREKADLIHLHNAPGAFWGTLASLCARRRTPIVRTEHRPWLPRELPALYRSLHSNLAGRAARIICVSDYVRSSHGERFPGLSERMVTVPNGVRIDAFRDLPGRRESRARFKLPPDTPIVGTIGRLVPVKNHRLLIDAFARVHAEMPEAHLAILGDGPLGASLAAHAADLRLSNDISFVTSSPSAEVFLRCLDVFALSSDSEGMPLTLLEAMAAGVPVAATDVGGIPEVIENGRDGLLAPPSSPEPLARAISSLLSHSAEAGEMAQRAREKVERLYSAERTVRETERIYTELLEA
ncbi:MAG TPA: glycosyltransferase [Candidatus Eisenbacteria bacterium]|uniref:Glycosyltransferase n=1 Tax=Eiseniibacteriota bacterium TaxID=2212470 RepID=A0A7V2ATK6_UNCEI|nr:glycosyltransferase [Candidatus Eisenbacteria bacterium]